MKDFFFAFGVLLLCGALFEYAPREILEVVIVVLSLTLLHKCTHSCPK